MNDQLISKCRQFARVMTQTRISWLLSSVEIVGRKSINILFVDPTKQKWINHRGIQKLEGVLNLKETCGYITFINTGVPDIGCEKYDNDVHLMKSKRISKAKERRRASQASTGASAQSSEYIVRYICFWKMFYLIKLIQFFKAKCNIEKSSGNVITFGCYRNNKLRFCPKCIGANVKITKRKPFWHHRTNSVTG